MNDFKKEYRTITPEEYHLFETIGANRLVKTTKSGKLTKNRQILYDTLITETQYSDVICCWQTQNQIKRLLILDGQHRKFCLCKDQKPVDVKILSNNDGSELNDEQIDKAVRVLNNSNIPWKNQQYMDWGIKFNQDPYIKQFFEFNSKYRNIDINVLGMIVTGDSKYNIKSKIAARTLVFDLNEEKLNKLNFRLHCINDCTSTLLSERAKINEKGIRKVSINRMLITFFEARGYTVENINLVNFVFKNNPDKFIMDDSSILLNVLQRYL